MLNNLLYKKQNQKGNFKFLELKILFIKICRNLLTCYSQIGSSLWIHLSRKKWLQQISFQFDKLEEESQSTEQRNEKNNKDTREGE